MTESPPVRYSIGQNDYDPEVGRRLAIYVDGAEVNRVVEYDCEAGTVLRNKTDENGKPQLNEERDEVLRETLTGVVTVEWRV